MTEDTFDLIFRLRDDVSGPLAAVKDRVKQTADQVAGLRPKLQEVGDTARGSVNGVGAFHKSLDQVDRTLSSVGINIGPQVQALRELSAASGQTATNLGLVASAGLTVAAAVGGWQLGRHISEWGGLDEKIGNATARLFGWGNLAGEEAAAKTETLARASIIAGETITDLGKAAKIVEGEYRKNVAISIDWVEQLRKAEGRVSELTAAQLKDIEAGKQAGATTEQLKLKYGLTTVELRLAEEQIRKNEQAIKEKEAADRKLHEAMIELDSTGATWRETIRSMTPVMLEQIKIYLDAGVSQGALRTAYDLTEAEIRAVVEALKDEKRVAEEAAKEHERWAEAQLKASQEAGVLWGEYHELRVQQGGTATDIQIAQVERWKTETIAKMKEAGTYNAETYTAIESVAAAKLDAVRIDWQAVGKHSREALQQTADKAQATFQYMLDHADRFAPDVINDFWRVAEEAQAAADNWGSSFNSNLDAVRDKAKQTAEDLRAVATAMTNSVQSIAGVFDVPNVNPVTGEGMEGTDPRVIAFLQKGYSLGEAISLAGGYGFGIGQPHGYWDETGWHESGPGGFTGMRPGATGPRPPGRADGGPVAAGMRYWVGERGPELFVPNRSGTIVASGGGVAVNVYINGSVLSDEQKIASAVKSALAYDERLQGARWGVA